MFVLKNGVPFHRNTIFDLTNRCFSRAVVMFLVEEVQRNIFDHRYVEDELWKR